MKQKRDKVMARHIKNTRTLPKKFGVFFSFLLLLIPAIASSTPVSIEVNATISGSGDQWGLGGASLRVVYSGDTDSDPSNTYDYPLFYYGSSAFNGLTVSIDITGNTACSACSDTNLIYDLTDMSTTATMSVTNEYPSSGSVDDFGLIPNPLFIGGGFAHDIQWNAMNFLLGSNSVIPGSAPVQSLDFLKSLDTSSLEMADERFDDIIVDGSASYKLLNTTISIVVDESQVPEPSVIALLGLGLAGIGWRRKAKTQR